MGAAGNLLFVVCGVTLVMHALFRSPVVDNVEPVPQAVDAAGAAPARRVVVFVADGLRADTCFDTLASDSQRSLFLRRVVDAQALWGVSHARVPTESRPGHVALFAGMYEDLSAIFKGWKDNPVDFDSVFNASDASFLFGSPDIVHVFTHHSRAAHMYEATYPGEEEDFARSDASRLDTWVFDRVEQLLAGADAAQSRLLHGDRVVLFLHLLATDMIGHAQRPHSPQYRASMRAVDAGVQRVVDAIQRHFPDNGTAFVLTSDHGMSRTGSHGDGDEDNTRTPLIVWGAGVPTEVAARGTSSCHLSLPGDVHAPEWPLRRDARSDVEQADVAVLLAALLGTRVPRHSVGRLPLCFLDATPHRAAASVSAAWQLRQLLAAHAGSRRHALLRHVATRAVDTCEAAVALARAAVIAGQWSRSEDHARAAVRVCLDGLQAVQRTVRIPAMVLVTVGYAGWIAWLCIQSSEAIRRAPASPPWSWRGVAAVACGGALLVSVCWAEHYPWYVAAAVVPMYLVWVAVVVDAARLREHRRALGTALSWRRIVLAAVAWTVAAELFVACYTQRAALSGLLLLAASEPWWPALGVSLDAVLQPALSDTVAASGVAPTLHSVRERVVWSAGCALLAVFPLLPPAEDPSVAITVCGSAALIAVASLAGRHNRRCEQCSWAADARDVLVLSACLLSSCGAWVALTVTEHSLAGGRGLAWFMQAVNILLAVTPLAAPALLSQRSATCQRAKTFRLCAVVLSVAPLYTLLSVSYETACLAVIIAALLWRAPRHCSAVSAGSASVGVGTTVPHSDSCSSLLLFLVFFQTAFFGSGNIASISSFHLSSTFRFVSVFAPHVMAVLLVIKLLVPHVVVGCCFATTDWRAQGSSLLAAPFTLRVTAFTSSWALHLLLQVRSEGSWKEIGNSVSACIVAAGTCVLVSLVSVVSALLLHVGRLPLDTAVEQTDIRGCTSDNSEKTA